jgi:hypothetical protein
MFIKVKKTLNKQCKGIKMYNTIFFFSVHAEWRAICFEHEDIESGQVSNEPRSKMSAGIMYVDRAHLLEGVTIQNRIN